MKRIIKIITSLALSSVVALSASAVYAEETVGTLYEKTTDIFYKYDYIYNLFVGSTPDPGSTYLYYQYDDVQSVRPVFEEVYEYLRTPIDEITLEEAQINYSMLCNAVDSVRMGEKELNFLVSICEKWLNNDNNYYSNEFWDAYTAQLDRTKEVIANYETAAPADTQNAYWDLYEKFNEACVYNSVAGDMDGDGKVTIEDAMVVQSYLAGVYDFNASQIYAKNNIAYKEDSSVRHVTKIQMAVAGQETLEKSYPFTKIEEYLSEEKSVYDLDYKINDIIYSEYSDRDIVVP